MAKILIADDDAHIARVMSIWLARHGHHPVCVSNGVQALDVIKSQSVDLVISDMNMPELDGLGFVMMQTPSARPRGGRNCCAAPRARASATPWH